MLDLARLERIELSPVPRVQILLARLLRLDYALPRRTEIAIEGLENLPRDRSVFIAMNHTDRYNYWPFQYQLWRSGLPFTVTWVKGKYYENALLGAFMDATNNIPIPSRGYALTTAFRARTGRLPDEAEYRALRELLDGGRPELAPVAGYLAACGGAEAWREATGAMFSAMIDEVLRLNRQAMALGHYIIVFPEGTRSRRLSRGHTGLAQVSQHLGAAVVPVGCSGSDRLYPGDLPFSRGGRVVYRIGAPMEVDGALADLRVTEPFRPLSAEATRRHGQRFQAITDRIMDRINELLDPPYRYGEAELARGVHRFV